MNSILPTVLETYGTGQGDNPCAEQEDDWEVLVNEGIEARRRWPATATRPASTFSNWLARTPNGTDCRNDPTELP